MKKAIFLRLLLLSTLTVLVFSAVISVAFHYRYEKDLRQTMLSTLSAAAVTADRTGVYRQLARILSDAVGGLRVTIILPDGTVAADTDADELSADSHYDRPEVVQARATGRGYAKRYSQTLQTDYLYVAWKSPEGVIYRAAQAVDGMQSSVSRLLPATLVGLAAAVVFSLILAARTVSSVVSPIESLSDEIEVIRNGDYARRLSEPRYEELSPLVSSVNALIKGLVSAFEKLEGEKDKLAFVLDNMKQGLVVVDDQLRIRICNNTAKALFNNTGDFNSKPLLHLTHSPRIVSAVEVAVADGTSALFNMDIDYFEKVYAVSVNPFSAGWIHNGAMVVLTDVTQTAKMEQLRREFVENASHELKTPITSINGFSELLVSGMIYSPEQREDYLRRILDESRRMAAILEDILRLSSLEDNDAPKPAQPVDLLAAARMAADALEPQARERRIAVTVNGENALLRADEEDMRHLFSNLIDNAIKYTDPGGRVTVRIAYENAVPSFSVEDNGIGIPAKDIPRVFERFYRVDKGRSRMVGGTGLGLSIVKHIVARYNGELQIQSKVGEGSRLCVTFPRTT